MSTTIVTLVAGEVYHVETPHLTSYIFQSGNAGTVPIPEGDKAVSIKDDQGKLVFSWRMNRNATRRDRVTIEDIPDEKTSVVKVTTEDVEEPIGGENTEDSSHQEVATEEIDETVKLNSENLPEQSTSQTVNRSGGSNHLISNIIEPQAHSNKTSPRTVTEKTELHAPSNADINEDDGRGVTIEELRVNPSTNFNMEQILSSPLITEPSEEAASSSATSGSSQMQKGASKRRNDSELKPEVGSKRQAINPTRGETGSTSNITVVHNNRQIVQFQGNQHQHDQQQQQRQQNAQDTGADIRRNETKKFTGVHDRVLTANGGHVVLQGCGTIEINGNVQTVLLLGAGDFIVNGNVEEGVQMSGAGTIEVYGNVWGRIRLPGAGDIIIYGDVFGDINLSGVGSLTVHGRHQNGRVHRTGFADFEIYNESHNY